MKPGRFTYEAAQTIEGVLSSLAARGDDARLIAGGQSLAPMLNMRLARPEHLIDINGLKELADIRLTGPSEKTESTKGSFTVRPHAGASDVSRWIHRAHRRKGEKQAFRLGTF